MDAGTAGPVGVKGSARIFRGWRYRLILSLLVISAADMLSTPILVPSHGGVKIVSMCPSGMSYDSLLGLCVPPGMSYDTTFAIPPRCGSGPAVCRGPVPRPPQPGGKPVEVPGGGYKPGRN